MDKARRVVGALMLAAPLVAEFGYMLVHGAKLALIVCGSVLGVIAWLYVAVTLLDSPAPPRKDIAE